MTDTEPTPRQDNPTDDQQRARVLFLVRVPVERTEAFLAAYQRIRYAVAEGVPGHLVDQVCRSTEDPAQWLITSEWARLADFEAWERSPEHRDLVRPLAEQITERRSVRFVIHEETRRRTAAPATTTARS
ncbi:antibiotic biosynthesis monooxygenase family protein [Kitasatospora viridis]|uniref:Antibiotic biosynthesis monooxygenase n=1 Tax=Kitasatospora viridis TaxID=281105 RepID=A0A561UCH2_9ACTN|nr:antibiotic biosynthesis monooxygenase family protein [Kitasatospora viridis]TWF97063.1 antibiotic biosynthesis monooxygenase [Kitasatospora viridis]